MPGRIYADTASADIATPTAGAGVGSTAAVAVTAGSNDQRGTVTVTGGGSGQSLGANSTITFVFASAFEEAPTVIAQRSGGTMGATIVPYVTSVTTTGFVTNFAVVPESSGTVKISYIALG